MAQQPRQGCRTRIEARTADRWDPPALAVSKQSRRNKFRRKFALCPLRISTVNHADPGMPRDEHAAALNLIDRICPPSKQRQAPTYACLWLFVEFMEHAAEFIGKQPALPYELRNE